MYKGTMKSDGNGNFIVELKQPSSGIIDIATKAGIAALCGAASYLGSYIVQKIVEASENSKKKDESKK